MTTSERHLLGPSPASTVPPTPSSPSTPSGPNNNLSCFSFGTSSRPALKLPPRAASSSSSSYPADSRPAAFPSSQSEAGTPVAELPLFDISSDADASYATPRFFSSRSISAAEPNDSRPTAVDVKHDDENARRQPRFDLAPGLAQKDAAEAAGGNNARRRHSTQPSRQEGFSGVIASSRIGNLNEDPGTTRVVHINDPDRSSLGNKTGGVAGNSVRTSKYTILSFLPKNLFEQFQRVAYIYFLIIVVLNQIPPLAVFGRTASVFPLAFVLVATAVKDSYEDWTRHRSDRVENNRTSLVLQGGLYQPKKWKHIRVGEMIKIHANEIIPADVVMLGSSETSGVAYVETMNLDGESNLKTRFAKQDTSGLSPEDGPISGTLICELPNRNIYEFQAYLDMDGEHIPLGPNNILLRGCELRNTSWVIGVVVYAGKQTKAMLNNSGAQHKRSRLERQMNKATGYLVIFLLALCSVGGIGMGVWLNNHKHYLNDLPFYRKKDYSDNEDYNYYGLFGEAVVAFLSCIIVFQVMVPIALYISLELVKLWQAHFMTRDMALYHGDSNSRFQCRALNINEDLGQVKYIFSDKTGTLTENKMEFHSASVAGVDYGNAQAIETPADSEGMISHEDNAVILGNQKWKPKVGAKVDLQLLEILQSPTDTPERRVAHEYMLVLAACNTIVPTRVHRGSNGQLEMQAAGNNDDDSGHIEYQGESPDEQALVSAAASYGYVLLERNFNSILISVMGTPHRYEVLGLHEFDSVRKRMSVIIRCPDGTMKVLVKGADNAVLDVLARGNGDDEINVVEEKHRNGVMLATASHLDEYSTKGLRTLVVASRVIDSKQYNSWRHQYDKASTALNGRAGLLRETSELVETDLLLLGATAIEDRLQDGVPETIASLREAGINVWVLTGDKRETAISIGYSCQLLTEDMQQITIRETTKEGALQSLRAANKLHGIVAEQNKGAVENENIISASKEQLGNSQASSQAFVGADGVLSSFGSFSSGRDLTGKQLPSKVTLQQLALIIDGNSLVHALQPDVEEELYHVARACKVVICCRVAPLQKAAVVNLIKRKTGELTLAIGDGANDVSMIQMADVGIGLSGQEGRQAVMASDFSMGQFRFLKRLLLVHGHWNYQRLSYMILYNFYRNAVFVFMLFWLILYTAYSPQNAVTDWSLVFYSLIYTSVPTIVIGTLDKNLSHRTLYKYPALYGVGQRGEGYNEPLFWITMLDTVWQSLVLFYIPYLSYHRSDVDLYGLGSIWTFGVVLLVNLHLAMDVYRWNWLSHASIWGSILVTFVCMIVLDSLAIDGFLINYGSMKHILGDVKFYINILIILPVALLPRFCMKVMRQRFWPSDIQIAREAEIKGTLSNRNDRYGKNVELNNMPLA